MKRLFLGVFLSLVLNSANAEKPVLAKPAPDLLKNKNRFEQLELFNKVLFLIESQYYRNVNTEKLVEGAIQGMLETLDPHSSYLNKEYFQKMQSDTKGEFGGLGIEVTQKDGVLIVITPIDDTPAFRAGIKPKDKIVEINHEPIIGLSLDSALEKMRGPNGASITLGIAREGEESIKHFSMKRELIKIDPVKSELLSNNYAYLRLTQFQKRSAETLEEKLKAMTKEAKSNGGLKGIILDLRSNPGGLLDQAVDISSMFLSEGIVVSTEARDPQNKDIRYVKKQGFKDTHTPMVVLINGASASASEIVAGAMQDYSRAIIIGTQSFGKGSVQTVAQLDKEVGVKLTIAQYMTPKNRKIQAIGITPDIILEDVDMNSVEKNKKSDRFVRERDLKNYLTATIESPEEKVHREKIDREERAVRLKQYENDKKSSKEKSEDTNSSNPKKDFQVLQAVNYLKGLTIFEMKKVKN
jgi:carboxyl-terminal processing protease